MKLPLTDEFLLATYDLLELGNEAFETVFLSIPRSLRESVELNRLRRRYERKKRKRNFSQFVHYLKAKGYIKIKNLEKKRAIMLTKKGVEKALTAKFKTEKGRRRKDGKWLMVIFDIPEKKRESRDTFRRYLEILRFRMLQKSVWVCPFDVSEKLESIIRRYSLDAYIKIFLIEEI